MKIINLIFNIYEGKTSNIVDINFLGNKFFSNRYLSNIIKSDSKTFLSFFSGGSNFDKKLFQYDRDLLINLYKDNGYFDIKINYQLNRVINKNYELNFYIDENERTIISKVDFPTEELLEFPEILEIFLNYLIIQKMINFIMIKNLFTAFIDESNKNLEKIILIIFTLIIHLILLIRLCIEKLIKLKKSNLLLIK